MNKGASLVISGAAVTAAAIAGARNGPQEPRAAVWYAGLHKPRGTPPGPVIGVTWTVLEMLLIGIGYRLLKLPNTSPRGVALGAWTFTLAGLAGYPWLFFRRKRLDSSAATAGAMLVGSLGMTAAAQEVDKPAAAMAVPLIVWLGLATLLSEELWRRNR